MRHGRCRLRLAARAADHSTWSATGRCAGPDCRPGGWAFQYCEPALSRTSTTPPWSACCCTATAIRRMPRRSRAPANGSSACSRSDGGWGAFEPENTHLYLNNIPFADHGALLDPPTADVTARCVSFLAQIGMPADDPVLARALGVPAPRAGGGRKLVRPLGHQLHLRHMVGAVRAERRRRAAHDDPAMRRAVAWLLSVQREDGGWGEDEESYARRAARPLQGEHAEPDRVGVARPDGGGRGRIIRRSRAASTYLAATQARGWGMARTAVQRRRFPARVLSALPRLSPVFPAAGAGALPQPPARQ